ncbi:M55 family metallopeptidase [Microlunatus soli]|uniref:D-amino peptidase n=1 Tax=Microlunatus soli TaxID=630515 RepID=A0A1H1UFV7_9ACTN|nr:M55 family metallopeptidase [Microlunatus soli]SDS71318.1 D-amino peptidase [Microlunatus soli]
MQVLISADMEGATGVTYPRDVRPRSEEWHRFRHLFTADVNAISLGLLDVGAEVLINEAHATMRNLVLEELDERVRMLTGKHKRLGMMEGIDQADGVVFAGYHAAAGQRGILAHTYLANSITSVWLDGVIASEGRLNAALAAEYGVPVILVTGDDKTCQDAADYAPDAEVAALKTYISRYSAICLPPARTQELQRSAARSAATKIGKVAPITGRHRIEVEFDAVQLADATAIIPTVEQVDHRRVGYSAATMTEAMTTFKIVTAIAAGAMEESYG